MIIQMPQAEMHMILISPVTGESRRFHADYIKKAIMKPAMGRGSVTLEMYDEDGNDGDTIVIDDIDIVSYKILSSLGRDNAFEIEFK